MIRRQLTPLLALLALIPVACDGQERDAGEAADTRAAAPAPAPAEPAQVTAEQFAQLRWLEGTWRGSGDEQPTFYERYAFVDDSTIRAESASDSTFPNPEEGSAIRLREGHVVTGDSVYAWAVTSIDARTVRFDPVSGATNAFTWTSESDSAWTARLMWNDSQGRAQERVYQMRRMQ